MLKYTKAQIKGMKPARVRIGKVKVKLPAPGKIARWPRYMLLANTVTEGGVKKAAEWRRLAAHKSKPYIPFVREA